MGASLANSGLIDRLTATRARVASLLIDLKIVLEGSTAIDPIDTRSVCFNSTCQGEPDGFQEPGSILLVKRFTGSQGVNAGSEKRFVGVDVSHASQKVLVEQQGFYRSFSCLQHFMEAFGCQDGIVRLWSQRGKEALRVVHQPYSAKFARIVEAEPPARVEIQYHAVVLSERGR